MGVALEEPDRNDNARYIAALHIALSHRRLDTSALLVAARTAGFRAGRVRPECDIPFPYIGQIGICQLSAIETSVHQIAYLKMVREGPKETFWILHC